MARFTRTLAALAALGSLSLPARADEACAAAPPESLDDEQVLLQAYAKARKQEPDAPAVDAAPDAPADDAAPADAPAVDAAPADAPAADAPAVAKTVAPAGYGGPAPCVLKPGVIVTLTSGRSGKFCSDRGLSWVCDKSTAGATERFELVDAGVGLLGFRGGRFGKMCADTGTAMECNRDWIRKWEWYRVATVAANRVTLQGSRAGTFCTDDGAGVRCDKTSAATNNEKFGVACVGTVPPSTYTLLYALNPGDSVIVTTTCPEGSAGYGIGFCTDETCDTAPLVFGLKYADRAGTTNSNIAGKAGTELRGTLPVTVVSGKPTAVRFVWQPARWEIAANDVRVPSLDLTHRTAAWAKLIKVTTNGGCSTNFQIIRAPTTTTTKAATTTTRATTTTTKATTTTTRATTTTTRATTTTTRPTTTTARPTTHAPTTTPNDGY